MFLYFLIYLFVNFISFINSLNINYVIVIDGGSTGSRGFIFRFDGNNNINVTKGKKITPGISSFLDHSNDLWDYFSPVFYDAIENIPQEYHSQTQVFILGTAGMRLLTDDQQEFLWNRLYEELNRSTFPFQLVRDNLKTIDGKLEAYYAVIASNFILGNIGVDLIPNGGMVGALDMGGSSTQLVFHTGTNPNERVEPDHFWSHSWLSFGAEKIQERIWTSLIENNPKSIESQNEILYNPCLFKGFQTQYFLNTSTNEGLENSNYIIMEGTGEPLKCRDIIRQTLWPEGCPSGGPCAVDNIEHPPVDGAFFGISVYFFAFDCVRHYGNKHLLHWPNPSIDELEDASISFCSIPWNDIYSTHQEKSHEMTSDEKLPNRCVEALYITTLLEDGFGFRGTHRGITLALEVDGTEVEWTLGFALAEECAQTNQISSSNNNNNNNQNNQNNNNQINDETLLPKESNNNDDNDDNDQNNDKNSDQNDNNNKNISLTRNVEGNKYINKIFNTPKLLKQSILPYYLQTKELLKQRILFLVKTFSSMSAFSQLLSKSFETLSVRLKHLNNIVIIKPLHNLLHNLRLLVQRVHQRATIFHLKVQQSYQSIKSFTTSLPQYIFLRNNTKSK